MEQVLARAAVPTGVSVIRPAGTNAVMSDTPDFVSPDPNPPVHPAPASPATLNPDAAPTDPNAAPDSGGGDSGEDTDTAD